VYFFCAPLCPKFGSCCVMHVTGTDPVDRNKGDIGAMHASARREREKRRETTAREAAKGVVHALRRRTGRPRRVDVEDEPQPHADLDYEHMDVEHQAEDDVEAMEEDVKEDAHKQRRRRRGKKVVEPNPESLDDYPGGPHDTTLLLNVMLQIEFSV